MQVKYTVVWQGIKGAITDTFSTAFYPSGYDLSMVEPLDTKAWVTAAFIAEDEAEPEYEHLQVLFIYEGAPFECKLDQDEGND